MRAGLVVVLQKVKEAVNESVAIISNIPVIDAAKFKERLDRLIEEEKQAT